MTFTISRNTGTYIATSYPAPPLFQHSQRSPRCHLPISPMCNLPHTGRARLKIHLHRCTLAEHDHALLYMEQFHRDIYSSSAAGIYRNLLHGYRSPWAVSSIQLNNAEIRLAFQHRTDKSRTSLRIFLPEDLPKLDLAIELAPHWPCLPHQITHFVVALLRDPQPLNQTTPTIDDLSSAYSLLAELQPPITRIPFVDAVGHRRHLYQTKNILFTSFIPNTAGDITVEQWREPQ